MSAPNVFLRSGDYDVIGSMINAYRERIPGKGSVSSPKAQWSKDQWVQKKNCRSPYHVEVPDTLKLVPRR